MKNTIIEMLLLVIGLPVCSAQNTNK